MTGDDDQQVLEIAKKKMESIVLALTIVSGAPLILSDVQIDHINDPRLAEDIVKTRSALLHSGKKETEVNRYIPYMENTILGIMREYLD